MTIADLFAAGLDPSEFMAAAYLLSVSDDGVIRASSQEVAGVLGCSRSTAHRVVAQLVARGLFLRPSRGVLLVNYEVSPVRQAQAGEVSPVRQTAREVPPVRLPRYVTDEDIVTKSSLSIEEPDGSSISGGCAPVKGVKIIPRYFDDGEDLAGVGHIRRPMSDPKKTRAERRKDLKHHRLTPREEWDMAFVAKEFRLRIAKERPDILGEAGDGRDLIMALRTWATNHGLTPQDAATAVDMFFDDSVLIADLTGTPRPYRVFLRFLQDQHRGVVESQYDEDWVSSLSSKFDELR